MSEEQLSRIREELSKVRSRYSQAGFSRTINMAKNPEERRLKIMHDQMEILERFIDKNLGKGEFDIEKFLDRCNRLLDNYFKSLGA